MNLMEELEVNDYLVFKRDGDGGPLTLVGGRSEALIIHATRAQKVLEGKYRWKINLLCFISISFHSQHLAKLFF